MKRKIALLLAISLGTGMMLAQKQTDRFAEIIDAKLLHLNREEPRSTFYSFTD